MLSGKTGFTGKAGYCYVAALKKEGKAFTVALLGCGGNCHRTRRTNGRICGKLDQYAFDTYNWYDIFDRGENISGGGGEAGRERNDGAHTESAIGKTDVSDASARGQKPDIRYEYRPSWKHRFMKDRRSGRHPIILMTSRWLLIDSCGRNSGED